MFRMLIKKINKSRWMVLALLMGLVLSISIVTAIPMYSRSILQRLIHRDLEEIQISQSRFPGYHVFHLNLAATEEENSDGDVLTPAGIRDWDQRPTDYKEYKNTEPKNLLYKFNTIDEDITKRVMPQLKLPNISKSNIYSIYKLVVKEKKDGEVINRNEFGKLNAISNIQDHIKIKSGKMFSNKINENGEYEVIVSEQTAQTLNLFLNNSYLVYQPYKNYLNSNDFFKIKVVGIYTYKDQSDPFWLDWGGTSSRSIIMDYELLEKQFLLNNPKIVVSQMDWGYSLDYKKVSPLNLKNILSQLKLQKDSVSNYSIELLSPMHYVLEGYQGKESGIKNLLWIFEAPILLMLIIFTFMVSNLIVEQDKDEIGVLKSRGAKNKQILYVYLAQGLFLSGIGVILGPIIGRFLCKIIGASNGFLEFVQRKGIIAKIELTDYLYCIPVILVFILTILICAYNAAKMSIVEHKQQKMQRGSKKLWKKFYLDFIMLGICGYGYYSYKMRENITASMNISGNTMPVDPLIYLISTLFILGLGLLFLRIYPYIVKLIYKLGKKIWTPVVYTSLINVARSEGRNQFIMLFLILTISIGIFNVKSARSVNRYIEEKTRYMIGADMRLKTKWKSDIDDLSESEKSKVRGRINYKETSFSVYKDIKGIDIATKVYLAENAPAFILKNSGVDDEFKPQSINGVCLMGIIPYEFGKVAWFNPQLNPIHWYDYLNYITENPNTAIISRSLQDVYKLNVGSKIYVEYNGSYTELIVGGIIDYWPTLNPASAGSKELIVTNLYYLQHNSAIKPYEVWIKKTSGYSEEKLYENIKAAGINIERVNDADQELIKIKNEPSLQGTNGALSMGFIATMIITAIGFLIYWIMSIRNRTLQFGIFRAMGLSTKKIIGMLMCEQFLVSGVAIIMGTLIGQLNCLIFVPMIKLTMKASEMVLPFKIIAYVSDYLKLYSIIGIVLIIGFTILARIITRMKINQAIKLGED